MLHPLAPYTKQVFEVHVFNTLTSREYYLWLDMSPTMRLLMKARKSVRITQSDFEFVTVQQKTQEELLTCSMHSNFDRSQFNLFREEGQERKKRLIATLRHTFTLANNKVIAMYYPKSDKTGEPAPLYLDEGTDLHSTYREGESYLIDYLLTGRLDMGKKLRVMSHFELRASQKSMEFKDGQGNFRVVIGKRGSKRYKIIVGPGLSPAQVFALAIVQIET